MSNPPDLRQLRTFQAIVEHGSFARAAEQLGIAQSTVTLHVQALEAEFGAPLFTRRSRQAELTEAGRTLLAYATRLLREADDLHRAMDDYGDGLSGKVHIGAIESAANVLLMPTLVRFIEERPRVQLRVEVGSTAGISGRVLAGELDMGLCAPAHVDGLIFERLFDQRFALLLPERHPLAERPAIYLDDLRGVRLLIPEPGGEYRSRVQAALGGHIAQMDTRVEIGALSGLKYGVQAGLGVAILPVLPFVSPPPGTLLRDLADVEITLPIGILRRQETGFASPALELLLERIRAAMAEALPATANPAAADRPSAFVN
ncbi:MAG TPA: LysR family transcriptional regulator [Thermomicrobiales bacterium]|nr:LysR family transcriptional regulator [Thermomicrobiales bacterium]